jgi:rubrerythrin
MSDNWDELIDKFAHFIRQETFTRDGSQDKYLATARAALRSAISAVEQERDALKKQHEMYAVIADNPNSDEAKQAIMLFARRYWSTESQIAVGLWMAGDKYQNMEAELKEANEDAERLSVSTEYDDRLLCRFCEGWGYTWEGEENVDHKPDCPVALHRARVGAK